MDPERDARIVLAFAFGQAPSVPGPAFGRGKPAIALQRCSPGQHRQGDLFDARTTCPQRRHRALERCGNGRLQRVEHHCAGHGQAPSRKRPGIQCRAARCQHLVQQHGVAHRARDRGSGVQRRRERYASRGRHSPGRALEADQPLQRGWNADRAAGVGAERRPCGTGGHRHRAARCRAAGDARLSVQHGCRRVGWRAVMRIDADTRERELGHVGVADQRSASTAQARHGRAVLACERGIVHRARRRGGWLASDVEQVLDR